MITSHRKNAPVPTPLPLSHSPFVSPSHPRALVSPTSRGNPVVDPALPLTREATSTTPPRNGPPLGPISTVTCSHPPTTFNLSLTGIPPTRVTNTPNPPGNGNIKHSSNKNTTYSKTTSSLLSVPPPPNPTITDISTTFIDNITEITLSSPNEGRKYNFSTIKNKNYRNSNNSNRLDPSPTPLLTPLPSEVNKHTVSNTGSKNRSGLKPPPVLASRAGILSFVSSPPTPPPTPPPLPRSPLLPLHPLPQHRHLPPYLTLPLHRQLK